MSVWVAAFKLIWESFKCVCFYQIYRIVYFKIWTRGEPAKNWFFFCVGTMIRLPSSHFSAFDKSTESQIFPSGDVSSLHFSLALIIDSVYPSECCCCGQWMNKCIESNRNEDLSNSWACYGLFKWFWTWSILVAFPLVHTFTPTQLVSFICSLIIWIKQTDNTNSHRLRYDHLNLLAFIWSVH